MEKQPEKQKPPIELSARVIESWLVRYPQKVVAAKVDNNNRPRDKGNLSMYG